MSAVGTTLLQSPGCNEGTARNGTLGTHGQKQNELRQGAAQTARAFVLCRIVASIGKVPPLRGSINVWKQLTQGLRPGLCRSAAPLGLFDDHG